MPTLPAAAAASLEPDDVVAAEDEDLDDLSVLSCVPHAVNASSGIAAKETVIRGESRFEVMHDTQP